MIMQNTFIVLGTALGLMLLLTGCELEFAPTPGGDERAPVVESLSIDSERALDNRALVVRDERTVLVTARVSASEELESIDILVSQDEKAYKTLASCELSPCDYDWQLDADDNGIYSFRVEASDVRGGLSRLPYSSSLVVEIP